MARGHIRPHGDSWRIYAYAGTDSLTGKPRQVTKVVHGSKKDAEKELTAVLGRIDAGRGPATNGRTFGQLLETFIDHKTLSVEMSTADSYRDQLVYIPARLRDMPLGRIDVETLEQLYADLCRRGRKRTVGGLSPRTVRKIHIVIHGAFELARRRRWVNVNPAADAEVPSVPRRLPTPAPSGAVGELLRAAASIHHALPLYLQVTVCVGGRRSEVHGLRWSSIDFTRAAVVLRDAVVFAGGEWRVKSYTKTGGQRTIRIDGNTLAKLEALHDRAFTDAMVCNVALPSEAFVFSDSAVGDRPWKPRTTLDRFQRACVAAGLDPKTRLHDLRSLMATHLIDEGIPVPVVSARLGHALNSTTLDVYTGRIAASDAAAAEVMGHLFDGNGRLTVE